MTRFYRDFRCRFRKRLQSLQAGSKWPYWRSEVTEVDAELKEDQTISRKLILKTEIQVFKSECLIVWILQATSSAANCNLIGK